MFKTGCPLHKTNHFQVKKLILLYLIIVHDWVAWFHQAVYFQCAQLIKASNFFVIGAKAFGLTIQNDD